MFKMRGMSSYTKTGRGIAIGESIGRSFARGGSRSQPCNPKYNVNITETKIEILDGICKDENGEWMKDTLVKLVPDEHPNNIYKGMPEIWVDKNRLQSYYFDQAVQDAINHALPSHLKGDITIRNQKISIRKNYDVLVFFVIFGLFVMYFKYL